MLLLLGIRHHGGVVVTLLSELGRRIARQCLPMRRDTGALLEILRRQGVREA